jgi:hypothetical protein
LTQDTADSLSDVSVDFIFDILIRVLAAELMQVARIIAGIIAGVAFIASIRKTVCVMFNCAVTLLTKAVVIADSLVDAINACLSERSIAAVAMVIASVVTLVIAGDMTMTTSISACFGSQDLSRDVS